MAGDGRDKSGSPRGERGTRDGNRRRAGGRSALNWLNPIIVSLTGRSRTLQMCRPTGCCLRSTDDPALWKTSPSGPGAQGDGSGKKRDGCRVGEEGCSAPERAGVDQMAWFRTPAVGQEIPGPAGRPSFDWPSGSARQPVCVWCLPAFCLLAHLELVKRNPQTSSTNLAFLFEPSNLLASAQFSSLDLSCHVSSLSPIAVRLPPHHASRPRPARTAIVARRKFTEHHHIDLCRLCRKSPHHNPEPPSQLNSPAHNHNHHHVCHQGPSPGCRARRAHPFHQIPRQAHNSRYV